MTLVEAKRKSNQYIFFGLLSLILSTLFIIPSVLRSLYATLNPNNPIDIALTGLITKLIKLIYSYTYKIPFIWDYSPIFDPHNWSLKGNYFFAALIFLAVFSYGYLCEGFSIKEQIGKEIREVNKEALRNDIKKAKGLYDKQQTNTLEIDVTIDTQDKWHKKPFGLIVIGVAIAVIANSIIFLASN